MKNIRPTFSLNVARNVSQYNWYKESEFRITAKIAWIRVLALLCGCVYWGILIILDPRTSANRIIYPGIKYQWFTRLVSLDEMEAVIICDSTERKFKNILQKRLNWQVACVCRQQNHYRDIDETCPADALCLAM